MRVLLTIVLLALLGTAVAAAELPRSIVWQAKLGNASSLVPYPSAQGATGVAVIGGEPSEVIRLDGRGQVVWRRPLGDSAGSMPACGDIDGDGQAEVLAATVRGRLVALSAAGQAKWTYELGHPFGSANIVIAPQPGGGTHVLINSQDGWLACLDGRGRPQWTYRTATDGYIGSPAAADLNGDGRPEYTCGLDADRIIALTNDGHLLWDCAADDQFGRETAVVADANRDGRPEAYIQRAGATSVLYAIDGPTGNVRWRQPLPSKCYNAVTVADLDGDGQAEVLAGTKYNQIFAFTNGGKLLWQRELGGNGIFFSPVVADIDGNGGLEIVTSCRQVDIKGNSLFVLDTKGNVLGSYPQENEGGSAPAAADLDGDGVLEVLSCSRNTVFAYHFGADPKPGKAVWPCYRGSSLLNGNRLPAAKATARPAMPATPAAAVLPARWQALLGDTRLRAAWPVKTPARGYLEVTLTDPQGRRLTQAFPTTPAKQAVMVSLPFGRAGSYELSSRLVDAGAHPARALVAERRRFAYTPLSTERAQVGATLQEIKAAIAAAPVTAPITAELARRQAALQGAFASLQARFEAAPADRPVPAAVLAAAAELRARLSREVAFARFARRVAAQAPEQLLVAWQDANPWDYADPRDELPAAPAAALKLAAWAYGSQKADLCLNLLGLGPEPFAVRVEPGELAGPDQAKARWQDHLALSQVLWMPTTHHPTPVPDMLPALNTARSVDLAPGSFAQLWLVVDTKGLAPGTWSIPLRLQSLTMAASAVEVTLQVEVLPVALPYPYPWKMCNWSSPANFPEPLRGRIIDNLISHGSNVIYAPTPGNTCDAEGNLTGTVDWTALDSLVARAKPGDPFLYFGSLPLAGPAGMTHDSPAWQKAYKEWMKQFVDHLASIGITKRDFAFYPVDEPGNSGHTGIEQLIAAARELRAADPTAPIYADPAGNAYTLEWLKELDPWVDVWQPARGLSSRPDFHEVMAAGGRRVWMYDAPGNVRVLDPLGFYRLQPWIALRDGAEGSGFWVYHYSDLWAVGATKEPDYGAVAIDGDQVVDSRRWRAAHDGVQDVTAVIVMDRLVAQAEQAGKAADLVARAKALRQAALTEITAREDDAKLDLSLLERHRRAIADVTVALQAAVR